MLAVLYDIHGNAAALEAVLREAEVAGAGRYLLGGDYVAWEPLGSETLALLRALPDATWIRGNGERWLVEPPADRPQVVPGVQEMAAQLGEEVDRLYALPERAELDGVLYVHGSPLSDVESFAAEPQEGEERMLAGVRNRTVVFGHSHLQFRRPGPNGTGLVNPGSVGMPLDGDVRAAWALWDGDFSFRRTEYDVERAAAAYRRVGGEVGESFARRVERGSD
ncbi:MAG: metallophosphoesterase family protein [Actinobacteria bacterium]|nr:metallophosphoesterase family protein [Actinomycetota bacterium]